MPNYINKLTVVDGNSVIREIDLSQDTVASAADIVSGKYGHLNTGERVLGTGQGGGTLVQKTITLNGAYDPEDDNADGYSEVTVNVQGGASMSEVANTYGTEVIITSAPGSTPSTTRHTLYFEYEDETTETVYAYYDDALIGPAITATTPTTHNNKTVTLAQLDGTTWYSYTPTPTPSGDYETIWEGVVPVVNREYVIADLISLGFNAGEVWRVTYNGTVYIENVQLYGDWLYYLGNVNLINEADPNDPPFLMYNVGEGGLSLNTRTDGNHTLKLERQISM